MIVNQNSLRLVLGWIFFPLHMHLLTLIEIEIDIEIGQEIRLLLTETQEAGENQDNVAVRSASWMAKRRAPAALKLRMLVQQQLIFSIVRHHRRSAGVSNNYDRKVQMKPAQTAASSRKEKLEEKKAALILPGFTCKA